MYLISNSRQGQLKLAYINGRLSHEQQRQIIIFGGGPGCNACQTMALKAGRTAERLGKSSGQIKVLWSYAVYNFSINQTYCSNSYINP